MITNEIFYPQKKNKTGVSSSSMLPPLEALNCFHSLGVAQSRTGSSDTNRGRKFWPILALMLAFSIDCIAGDTTSVLVHFAFDKYSLNNDAQMQLDRLARTASGTLTDVRVYGFTDQVGSNTYNKKLSFKRATQVRNYLVKAGVHPNIFTIVQGKGEAELLTDRMDKASMQQNRRVHVKIEYDGKLPEQAIPGAGNRKQDSTGLSRQETEPPALADQIKDDKVKTGDQIILRNINFEGGRHVFLQRSYSALTELLNVMKEIPTLKIRIQGHICCEQGPKDGLDSDLGSMDLSVQRARAVYNYLIENGIAAARMSYEGFGHQNPITEEHSEDDRIINRRVEIKIISK